jgi:hypothetical protein
VSRALFGATAPATWNRAGRSLVGAYFFLLVYAALRGSWV